MVLVIVVFVVSVVVCVVVCVVGHSVSFLNLNYNVSATVFCSASHLAYSSSDSTTIFICML